MVPELQLINCERQWFSGGRFIGSMVYSYQKQQPVAISLLQKSPSCGYGSTSGYEMLLPHMLMMKMSGYRDGNCGRP